MSETAVGRGGRTPTADLLAGKIPLIPVLHVENVEHAEPILFALEEAGIAAIEVTLRTAAAIKVIERMKRLATTAKIRAGGVVAATMARFHSMGTMAHDDLVCPPSVSACGHPARRLAVYAFTLSYRDVEDPLAERGLDISYETVRRWVLKFGPLFARELRRRRPRPTSRSHHR
jgi:KDPG and KHG aldolase